MASHPPAGDDLVARLAAAIDLGTRTGARGKHPSNIYNVAAEALEALTSQQHTEPVAGKVVAWRTKNAVKGYRVSLDKPFEGGEFNPHLSPPRNPIPEPLVTKAAYDALAAAKDAEIAELDFLLHEGGTWEEMLSKAERQRDVLRDVLADALDEHDTSHGEITDPDDPHWSVRARRLKNEGGARP